MIRLIGFLLLALGVGLAVEIAPQGLRDAQVAALAKIARENGLSPSIYRTETASAGPSAKAGRVERTGTADAAGPVATIRSFAPPLPLATAQSQLRNAPIAAPIAAMTARVSETPDVSPDKAEAVILSAVSESSPRVDDSTRLASELQRELLRVGCYHDVVDGDWGPGSKRAMASFARRVNATLPVDRPDIVLLSLVRSHRGRACGADCRAGETLSAAGHCVSPIVTAAVPKARKQTDSGAASRSGWAPLVVVEQRLMPRSAPVEAASDASVALVAGPTLASRPATGSTALPPAWSGRMALGAAPPPATALLPEPRRSAVRSAVTKEGEASRRTSPQRVRLTPPARVTFAPPRRPAIERYRARPSYVSRPPVRKRWAREIFANANMSAR